MCGIIALVRGPGRSTHPACLRRPDRLEPGGSAASRRRPIGCAVAGRVADLLVDLDRLLGSGDGIALLVRDRDTATRDRGRLPEVGSWIESAEADLDRDGASSEGHSLEEANAALLALKDAWWSVARDRLPTAAAVRDLVGDGASWSAVEVGHVDPAGPQRARPPRGAGQRFGRPHRAGARPRPRSRRPRRGVDGCGPIGRPALPVPRGAHRRRSSELRLQGGRRDRGAGRQHPRPSPGDPGRRPAPPRARPATGHRPSCSATPAGRASASSRSPTPTPSTASSSSARTAPTSPPCSTATSTTSPTSRRPTACGWRPRSPPTPRSSPRSSAAGWPTG